MQRTSLAAATREQGKSAVRDLRALGKVPAVLYGRTQQPVNLAVDAKEVKKAMSSKAGFNVLIDLKIGDTETIVARVCEYQAHPIHREFTHIDFQVVDLTRKIEVEVPLHFDGKSPGVKEGGVLDIQRRTLHIRCLPTSIPEFITVDISALNIGDNIHIDNVTLPEGAECPHHDNFTVVSVAAPHKEEVAVVAAVPVEGAAAPVAGAPAAAGAAPAGAAPAADKKPAGK